MLNLRPDTACTSRSASDCASTDVMASVIHSVHPDTQKHSQAKKLKAEVHSGDVTHAAFIGYCFIQ